MAVSHGMPGEWAKVRGTAVSLWPLFLCFALLGAFASAAVLGRHAALFGGLFACTLVGTAIWWRCGLRRVESFFKGARGEERTAQVLESLPDSWHVFHDFVAGGMHVDHVVAGPGGVFSVETKNWNAQVTVEDGEVLADGRLPSRPPHVQALREARAVARALSKNGDDVDVTPVVCFASCTCSGGDAEAAGGVHLANADSIVAWLLSRPEALPPNALERLLKLMEAGL